MTFQTSPISRFQLAIKGASVTGPSRQAAESAPSLEGRLALIVEDSWHIAVAMKSLLENAGLVVLGPAGRVEAAEELLAKTRPDIAVIDINLHGEMAYGLVDRLNALGVPIIVVSGYGPHEEISGKVSAVLSKPVRSRQLVQALQAALCQQPACGARC